MKAKYDRQSLKLEFFQSDIDEVKSFLSQKWIKLNWWGIAKQTNWWSKEKQEYKDKILQQVLERRAKEEAKSLEIPVDQLMKAKKAVISLFMQKLDKTLKQQKETDWEASFNVKEFEKILKVIKTELGEPTNISKTDATIKTEPIDESLLIKN